MKNKFLIFSFIFVMLLFLVSCGTVCEKKGHNYEAKDNNDGTHTLVCVNDPTHTLVEDCIMNEWLVVKAAQEFEEGVEERTCSQCGHKEQRSIASTHEHKLSEWTSIKDATCLEDGEEKRTCEGCEYFETRVVGKLGHDEVKHSAKNPTCSEIGYNEYVTCSRCDYTTYVEIPSTGKHNYSLDWTIDVTPTKESVGSKSHHCLNCDANTDITEIPMLPYTDGLNYVLTNDRSGYVVVGIGECLDEEINISPVYNGLPVKVIRRGAFSNCTFIKKVIIPNSVETMAISIFNGCSSLESITLPIIGAGKEANFYGENGNTFSLIFASSMSMIGGWFVPESLKEVIITGEVGLVEKRAFANCSFITSITLPEFTTEIGKEAFYDCQSLENIVVPYGVTDIEKGAFRDCKNLKSIKISNSVTRISDGAFENCSSLASIEIPNSVSYIGEGILEGCSSLTSLTIPFIGSTKNSNATLGYIFGRNDYTIQSSYIPTTLTKLMITDAEIIGERAFYNCEFLKEIVLPESLVTIKEYAFYGCTSLEELIIPNSVTTIEECAFYYCQSLKNIELSNNLTSLKLWTFYGCKSLENIVVPNSVTTIEESAFAGCKNLVSITVPFVGNSSDDQTESVAFGYIFGANNAFSNRTYVPNTLKEVIISGGNEIGIQAFYECESIETIKILEGVKTIKAGAFSSCTALKTVEIPNTVTTIEREAFSMCEKLTIYCEASSKPEGWNSDWNFMIASVEWGYKENKSQE